MPDTPNPIRVAWSIGRALRTRRPAPHGDGTANHALFAPVLHSLRKSGVAILPDLVDDIAQYRKELESVDPDTLRRDEALAYWLNCYNAGALALAAEALGAGAPTVLRVPGGFTRPWAEVAGSMLSLDDIEHGKIRRFKDPRIHGALVCGSASCPTLRFEPYDGGGLERQLEEQIRAFLAAGGAVADQANNTLLLSRVLLWFGGDFVRPKWMPTFLPASRRAIAQRVQRWLPPDVESWLQAERPKVAFQPYDWSLACAIR